jgi:hypothetical protein
MSEQNQLPIPPGASTDKESAEVLRAWIANQGLHVSMSQAFDDPETWGMLLVDIARHAARAMASEKICTEENALERMRDVMDAEWDEPTDLGSTQELKKQ